MVVEELELEGVFILKPKRYDDERGWLQESWKYSVWKQYFNQFEVLQENTSFSKIKGTLRGLHLQKEPFAQAKLVEVLNGEIFDVAVDVRSSSPNFGAWIGRKLSAENGHSMLIPEGFAHGFLTLCDNVLVRYKCGTEYEPTSEVTVHFEDPDIAIDWPIPLSEMTISKKDRAGISLKEFKILMDGKSA